jgi:UDP-glucuronate decarboxylase
MLELADLVLELTGSVSPIEHRELPADDPKQRQPNIDKAKKVLGWEPTIPLREGLEKTIAYFAGRV